VTAFFAVTGDAFAEIADDGRVRLSLEGSGAQCIARADGMVYVGCRGGGVLKSGDGRRTWGDAQLPQRDVFSIAVSRADGAVYAGCEPSALFRSDDEGRTWTELEALKRIPSAPTWSFPPRPWTSHVRWIAPSPHDANLLLVGIELGGLMTSEDRGETWADHRAGAKLDVHTLAWHPTSPGYAYEAAGDGTARTRDGGRSWEAVDAGRDRHYAWAVAADPHDPGTWFVSANPGPQLAHGRDPAQAFVYRWRGEGPWQALDGGLPQPLEAMPYALAATAGGLVAALRDGRLFRSDDRGDSWRPLEAEGLDKVVAMAAA
jgi:photosystem II stability/assembly factor-like uncharacterized protein